jgi:ribosomal protein S18 acetylase RimI-like enzyme
LNITISRAEESHLKHCVAALVNSELGRVYFPSEENALASLAEGLARDEVFVAVDEAGECLGFIWFILGGAFHGYPYLHMIAVKEEHRGEGIGKKLLAFFEEAVFAGAAKAFLVVADFNPDARRLYESLGYRQVGAIPGLYREGVTEYLMMKEKGPAADAPDTSTLDRLIAEGRARPASQSIDALPTPIELPPGAPAASEALRQMREDERW